jgi:hypothetical protein
MRLVSQHFTVPAATPLRRWAALGACATVGLVGAAAAPAAASTYTVTGLGSLGFGTTIATGINSSGQITRESYLATEIPIRCSDRRLKACFTHPAHAFLWSNGTMTDLGTLGGLDSEGTAINDHGEVVGSSGTATGSSAFTDVNGAGMTAITTGGPEAINDNGEIAGGGSFPVAGTRATCLSRHSRI